MMHQFNKPSTYLESTLTSEVELKNFKTYQVIPIHYLVEFFDSIRNYFGRILEK